MINDVEARKMNELMEDDAFAEKLAVANSLEEVHQLFVDNGVNVSLEEIQAGVAEIRSQMEEKGLVSEDGELSPEMLEMVSGGGWFKRIAKATLAGGTAVLAFGTGNVGAGVLLCIACYGSLRGY